MFKSEVLFLSEKGYICQNSDLWKGDDPDSWPIKLQQIFRNQNLQILLQAFEKARRRPQSKLIFCVVGLASYRVEKKAQNSEFDWGPLHGEIGLLKLQIFFFKYLRNNSWVKYLKLSQTFNSTLLLPSSNGQLCISSPKNASGIFGRW